MVTGLRGIPDIMGGVESVCEELMPRLAALGLDITVARRREYTGESSELKEWRGVKLIDIPTPRRKALEAIIHTYLAIRGARRGGYDTVHIHAIGPALLAPLAHAMGLRVIFTHHGFDYERAKWGFAARTALKMGERLGCRWADEIIVISEGIRQAVERKYGRTQGVHLIYNGAPKAQPCSLPEYFEELGIEEGKYVLAACRFVPEKNLHQLVEAFGLLHPEGYKLVLAGDADFEDDYSRGLKAEARRRGVVLPGFVHGAEKEALLTHAACYCLPSSHEGLPIALLEAMAYGLPVVVSDIPACREVGLEEECYFPCGDVEAMGRRLGEQLEKATRTPRRQYDMRAYDWDHIAEQTAAVYRGNAGPELPLK